MAKSDPNLLTQAEYARHRKAAGLPGGSREAVRRAVDEKRISVFGPDKLIDPVLADSQWERNTRARQSPQAAASVAEPDLVGQAAAASAPAGPMPAAAAVDTGYSAARARRENAEAEQAEIELKKMRGDLVAAEDVARAGFEIGRDLRDAMEASVNSLAAEVASIASAEACVDVLRRHNRAICEVLVKAWREKMGAAIKEPSA